MWTVNTYMHSNDTQNFPPCTQGDYTQKLMLPRKMLHVSNAHLDSSAPIWANEKTMAVSTKSKRLSIAILLKSWIAHWNNLGVNVQAHVQKKCLIGRLGCKQRGACSGSSRVNTSTVYSRWWKGQKKETKLVVAYSSHITVYTYLGGGLALLLFITTGLWRKAIQMPRLV